MQIIYFRLLTRLIKFFLSRTPSKQSRIDPNKFRYFDSNKILKYDIFDNERS